MPSVPKKQCNHSGCKHLQPCPIHPKKAWTRDKEPDRMRGRQLQRERELLFAEQPLCVLCLKRGITRAATIRDHIVPLAEWQGPGSPEDASNIQAVCSSCHTEKTAKESRRGKRRL
jgi:5-methylcytosine-specific restriction protein A